MPRRLQLTLARTAGHVALPASCHALAPIALATAMLVLAPLAQAQSTASSDTTAASDATGADISLPPLTAQGSRTADRQTTIGGFGKAPGWQQPMQATTLGQRQHGGGQCDGGQGVAGGGAGDVPGGAGKGQLQAAGHGHNNTRALTTVNAFGAG